MQVGCRRFDFTIGRELDFTAQLSQIFHAALDISDSKEFA